MGISVFFNGRKVVEPGVYTRIIGEPGVVTAPAPYGTTMIIDTGIGAGYGGGSGILGTLAKQKKAIYSFTDADSFRGFVKGGVLYDLADYLFGPSNNGPGIPQLLYARAATTGPGTLTYTFTGNPSGGSGTSTTTTTTTIVNGGVFSIRTKDEGLIVNGVLDTDSIKVVKGYGAKMFQGIVDTSKYYIEFYLGTFTGLDSSSEPYDGILKDDTQPILIARSAEFNNITDLISWAKNSSDFNAAFEIVTETVTGTGALGTGDFDSDFYLITGGTETYSANALNKTLEALVDEQISFFLCDKYGSDVEHANNQKILTHLATSAEFFGRMVVGGANDDADFETYSITAAVNYNHARAIVVHGGINVDSLLISNVLKPRDSIYKAALVCGRLAGLEPQTPGTYKDLKIKSERHILTKAERERCISAGVLHTRFVATLGIVINQSIDTLQRNTQLFNPDGTSYEISIMRIADQLNNELILNLRAVFPGNNVNTLDPEDVKVYTQGFLLNKTATKTQDNLIIRPDKVTVTLEQDFYSVRYGFVPNGPINKVFMTGVMLPLRITV